MNYGETAAMTGGSNVTIAAGETLASYVFSAQNATAETYEFILTVEDIADENAETLSWKGQSCHCSLPGVKEDVVSGVMEGQKDELNWMYYDNTHQVKVTGPAVTPAKPVFAASYDGNGKMLSFSIILNGGDGADIAKDAKLMKLFWVSSTGVPQCRNMEIQV